MEHSKYLEHLKENFQRLGVEKVESYAKEIELCESINLDPVADILDPLYDPKAPRKRRDPINMLRSTIVMAISTTTSVTNFVEKTRKEDTIAILCGWNPGDTPGIGTYYDFFNRLYNGKSGKSAEDLQGHSFLRILPNEIHDEEKNKITAAQVVKELLANAENTRPDDIDKRLHDIFTEVAIKPSVEHCTIPNPANLTVCGDGSYLHANSDGDGKKVCDCDANDCSHPRSYSSPDAVWGYYPSKEIYYFGYHPYTLSTVNEKNKVLELYIAMPPANANDYALSVQCTDNLLKSIKENNTPITIDTIAHDRGSNAFANFEYYDVKGIKTAIPLDDEEKAHIQKDNISFDADGTPFCKAGLCMRHHCYSKTKDVHYYNCPVKRPSHFDGKHIIKAHIEECPLNALCQPDSKMGPVIAINRSVNLKFYPEISRDSGKFKKAQDKLHQAERTHDSFKNDYKLEDKGRGHRKAYYYLIRYYASAIVNHAKAWLQTDDKTELKKRAKKFVFG